MHATLRREILDGILPSGAVLGEIEQSTRLGVSRTPLREALGRLVAEGLVSPGAGRRLVVTAVSPEQVRALFEVRKALEVEAARLAARRRDAAVFEALRSEFGDADEIIATDDEFLHAYYELASRLDQAIDDAVDNPYLLGPLQTVRAHIARIRRVSRDNPARLREAAREHLAIIDAIIDGAESVAAHATELHLHRSLASILASIGDAVPAEGRRRRIA
ncbi:GntR family transcriptional regulator [Gryllotalpicola sp.]|uniref:GntR family transcriptional regulator n=1 Tax=Gryllotalpicola sp. TaxID=1932787 RepID=UPI00342AD1C8